MPLMSLSIHGFPSFVLGEERRPIHSATYVSFPAHRVSPCSHDILQFDTPV